MNLWPVEHFFPRFFPDQHWSALIWKKTGEKVFNWSEDHFYQSELLQNPYISDLVLFGINVKIWRHI